MSLRRKAVFGIVLASAVLMSGLLLFDRLVISEQFDEVDEREARRDVRRAANSIGIEAENLDVLLIDWAFWDDTYAFMETRAPEYVASNLVTGVELMLGLDAFVFVDSGGSPILSFTRSIEGDSAPIPALEDGGVALSGILARTANGDAVSGIVSTEPGRPMLVAARPIVMSDGTGTPRGTLVMGRWLDGDFAERLTEQLGTPIAFGAPGPDDDEVVVDDRGWTAATATRDSGALQGRIVLMNIEGLPALVIETSQEREIGALKSQTFMLATGAIAATTIALMAVTVGVVHLGLLRPMLRLRRELASIEQGNEMGRVSVRGSDEIAEIAQDVNDMLDRLQQSTAEQARLTAVASEQEEVARTALLEMSEGFLAFDHEGRCRLCNPAAGRMLLVTPEEAWGRHFSELLPGLHREAAADGPQLIEVAGRTLAVTRSLGLRGRERAVVVLRDVSDVLDVERLKRDIIQTVSHELRTPLTAIRATVDLFDTGDAGTLSEVQLRMVRLLSRNTDRLLTIVNDLLVLSSLEGGNVTLIREPVDMSVLAERVVEDLRPAATAGQVALHLDAPGPAIAWGDEERLRHVLENLVQNAIKFGRPGGQAVVEVRDGPREVTVQVRDNGIGIPPEDRERVFDKFYRTKAAQRVTGSGLGLPIARLLVELHGGTIRADSDGQSGTVVTYTIPVAPAG